jgi:hypothetical protein
VGRVNPHGSGAAAADRDDPVMSSRRTVPALLALAALLALPAAGGAARSAVATHELRVDVTEWAVVPSQGLVASGPLRLTVTNDGVLVHKLAIAPTASWGDPPQVRHGRVVSLAAARPLVVAPGHRRSAQVILEPGSYVVFDAIAGHYSLGASIPILVR